MSGTAFVSTEGRSRPSSSSFRMLALLQSSRIRPRATRSASGIGIGQEVADHRLAPSDDRQGPEHRQLPTACSESTPCLQIAKNDIDAFQTTRMTVESSIAFQTPWRACQTPPFLSRLQSPGDYHYNHGSEVERPPDPHPHAALLAHESPHTPMARAARVARQWSMAARGMGISGPGPCSTSRTNSFKYHHPLRVSPFSTIIYKGSILYLSSISPEINDPSLQLGNCREDAPVDWFLSAEI